MSATLQEINTIRQNIKDKEAAAKLNEMIKTAPAAVEKLKKNSGNCSKLTMIEMNSILKVYYGKDTVKGKKAEVVAQFKKIYEADPQAIERTASAHMLQSGTTSIYDDIEIDDEIGDDEETMVAI